MLNQTHTYATLEISVPAFEEIAQKLKAAGYDHSFVVKKGEKTVIDMHGIALCPDQVPTMYPDADDWEAIKKAAMESKWMPPEYMKNHWVADVCAFLRGDDQRSPVHAPTSSTPDGKAGHLAVHHTRHPSA